MERKEVGDMIRKLKDGEAVPCPECNEGTVVPKDKWHSSCDKCEFTINLDQDKTLQ